MEDYYSLLMKSALFKNVEERDLPHLLKCLSVHIKEYQVDSYVFSLGDTVSYVGIVLEGHVEVVKENLAGNRNIVAFLGPSHIFGEGIVCTSKRISPVSVRVRETTKILFIPYERIIKSCGSACTFHTHLISNMLRLLGDKNYALNHKMDILMLRGMREKLVTYLLNEAYKSNSLSFNIGPNRNELAEYLNVSRTSMCRELARMKDEGLLDYYKNSFKLTNVEALKKCLQ